VLTLHPTGFAVLVTETEAFEGKWEITDSINRKITIEVGGKKYLMKITPDSKGMVAIEPFEYPPVTLMYQ